MSAEGVASAIEIQKTLVMNCMYGLNLRQHARATVRTSVLKVWAIEDRNVRAEGVNVGGDDRDKTGEGRALAQLERVSLETRGRTGVTVCAGSGLSATLCLLEGPAAVLVAVVSRGGGCATLAHCVGRRAGRCLLADSPRARLHVRGGRFQGSLAACTAQRGAVVSATGVSFRGRAALVPEQTGVSDRTVEGVVRVLTGSHGRFRSCRIRDGYIGLSNASGDVWLVDVTISDVRTTMPYTHGHRRGGRTAHLHAGGAGVSCMGGQLTWSGGVVERCVVGADIGDADRGKKRCRVVMEGVVFRDCVSGVYAIDECGVTASQCVFRGPQCKQREEPRVDLANKRLKVELSCGVMFAAGAVGSLSECVLDGWMACAAVTTARVVLEKCEFMVSVPGSVGVDAAGTVTVVGCGFRAPPGTAACALPCIGGGERVGVLCTSGGCEVRDSRFMGMADAAVKVGSTGASSTVSRSPQVTIVSTSVDGWLRAGAECGSGAHAAMGPWCAMGFAVYGDGRALVRDCCVEGAQTGVLVQSGTLSATRLTLNRAKIGLSVDCRYGPASADLVDAEVQARGCGVIAKGPQTQVWLLPFHRFIR